MWSLAGMHLAVTSFDEYFLQEFAGLIAEKRGEPDEVCHGELGVAKMAALALDADFHAVEGVLVETELEREPVASDAPCLAVPPEYLCEGFGEAVILNFLQVLQVYFWHVWHAKILVFERALGYIEVCYYFTEDCDGERTDWRGGEIAPKGHFYRIFEGKARKNTHLCDFWARII